MKYETLEVIEKDAIANVMLNRPHIHNAMNDVLIKELSCFFDALNHNKEVRALVLTVNGKTFCGGGDLHWMKSMVHYSMEQNISDSMNLLRLFESIYSCQKPVIGRINGSAFGGGVGLIAVCDITLTSSGNTFAFSESKLGLIPSVISTYVIRRIGPAQARRLFITGERFSSEYAKDIRLIDYLIDNDKIDQNIEQIVKEIKTSGPVAVGEAKNLIKANREMPIPQYKEYKINKIAELRISEEGQEGTTAFLEKRKPKWRI